MIYDDTICSLGEGPLWHPERQEFFWFDILSKCLHRKGQHWQFDECVSAAGWVNDDQMMIASQSALSLFTISTGQSDLIAPLEADNPITRSNDGRADPYGGFWIGTMGFNAEDKAGAIYRYYRGEVRKIIPDITITNAICFAPDGDFAYYVDTLDRRVMRVALDGDGWPVGDAVVWLDARGETWGVDGAVIDAQGRFWNAQWGANRVACYDQNAQFIEAVGFPATQTSCPAFGGNDLKTLFCTSAAEGIENSLNPHNGKTFAVDVDAIGQAEHRVIL
ncbi:SMP-30/gluconolactonase/LRE family protein [Aestuariibius sp. HNIBRBA575]|uniref:SMP-30/gluconolactonase/LRE family protein n=1 Tax=Aestuariibius sp. HNIBRBA575 TaxID=3233343 RepID=UPI0034A542B2